MLKFKQYTAEYGQPIIMEGGGFGHLSNVYDMDYSLAIMKKIISNAFTGKLETVSEKTDGQNLMISWKNNKLIAARNKGHLKNAGENALDSEGVKAKFKGRGELLRAYTDVMNDLTVAFSTLTDGEKEYFFQHGRQWISLEVMVPENENIVHYGVSEIRFHGTIHMDENGVADSPLNQSDGRYLEKLLKKHGSNQQSRFTIKGLSKIKLTNFKNAKSLIKKHSDTLSKVWSKYGLKPKDTMSDYKRAYIKKNVLEKLKTTQEVKDILLKRWVDNDKSIKITAIYKMDIKNKSVIQKADKSIGRAFGEMIAPISNVFANVGVEVIKTISTLMTVNPDKSKSKIADAMWKSVKDIKASDNEGLKKTLAIQMKRLEAVGGINSVAPTEGFTFFHNGELLKLTGSFSAINQITNLAWRL